MNDPLLMRDGKIDFESNNAGGILGGISTGAGHRLQNCSEADAIHRQAAAYSRPCLPARPRRSRSKEGTTRPFRPELCPWPSPWSLWFWPITCCGRGRQGSDFISFPGPDGLMRKEFRSLIPLQEAKSIIFDHAPRPRERPFPWKALWAAFWPRRSSPHVDVPGFHRASMDGYAVQAADTLESREDRPVSLRLAGCVPMGRLPDLRVARGEAAEVSTGSMMPDGADAVVMIEYSQAKGDRVHVRRPVYSGENVQTAGSDISFGEVVLFPGTKISLARDGRPGCPGPGDRAGAEPQGRCGLYRQSSSCLPATALAQARSMTSTPTP